MIVFYTEPTTTFPSSTTIGYALSVSSVDNTVDKILPISEATMDSTGPAGGAFAPEDWLLSGRLHRTDYVMGKNCIAAYTYRDDTSS